MQFQGIGMQKSTVIKKIMAHDLWVLVWFLRQSLCRNNAENERNLFGTRQERTVKQGQPTITYP